MSLEQFTDAYFTAALWSSGDGDVDCLLHSDHELSPETLEQMKADCRAFYTANESDIYCDGGPSTATASQAGMAGYDFWLTRCGHGAGFWDGDWPEPHASRLTAAAGAFGSVELYIGDDGKVRA